MADQSREMAHLRDLPKPKCHGGCGRTATVQLLNGLNAPMGVYCASCGRQALANFKARGRR